MLDTMRRWEDRELNLTCLAYGQLPPNGIHATLAKLNQKKHAVEQVDVKYRGATLESQFYPELESHMRAWLGSQLSDSV